MIGVAIAALLVVLAIELVAYLRDHHPAAVPGFLERRPELRIVIPSPLELERLQMLESRLRHDEALSPIGDEAAMIGVFGFDFPDVPRGDPE